MQIEINDPAIQDWLTSREDASQYVEELIAIDMRNAIDAADGTQEKEGFVAYVVEMLHCIYED